MLDQVFLQRVAQRRLADRCPSSTAMIVMPICTVASRRDGSAFSSSAASAPALPCRRHRLQPRRPRRDQRDLGHREKAVEQDQQQNDRELQGQHRKPHGGAVSRSAERVPGPSPKADEDAIRRTSTRPPPIAPATLSRTAGEGLKRTSARIVFDDEVRLHRHRIGHVGQLRRAHEAAAHAVVVDLDVIGHVALARLRSLRAPAPSPWPSGAARSCRRRAAGRTGC